MRNVEKQLFRYYKDEYSYCHPSIHVEDSMWKVGKILSVIQNQTRINCILDVGCGAGVILNELSQKLEAKHATGIDISSYILKKAKDINSRRRDSISFIQAHAALLPIMTKSLDIGLLIDILEHVISPTKVLSEQSRCSKYVVIKVPLKKTLSFVTFFDHILSEKNYGHIHRFNVNSFLQLVKLTGFDVLAYTIVADERKLKIRTYERIQKNIVKTSLKVASLLFSALAFRFSKIIFTKIFPYGHLIIFAKNRNW